MIDKIVEAGQPGTVRYEKRDRVAHFNIDGPTDLNPMSPDMYRQWYEHLVDFRDDKDVWVGVVEGAGPRCFSAGGDLKRMGEISQTFTPEMAAEHYWYPRSSEPLTTPQISLEMLSLELYKPMIAAVHGVCLGAGLIFVLALTDIRVAASNAQFGFAEIKLGAGGAGAVADVARRLPFTTAMWLSLTGENIDAEEAHRIGLVNEIVPEDAVHDRAQEVADLVCANSPVAVKFEKEAILRSHEMTRSDTLRMARMFFFARRQFHDTEEGLASFNEKRAPEYRGW